MDIKEIKLRPKTDDHDIAFKISAARRFLEAGHKVKFTVRFRGREITHPEKAHEQIDIIVKALEDVANIETRPMMEARAMSLVVAPKPAVMQRVAQQRAALEKARQQAEKEGKPHAARAVVVSSCRDEDDDDDDDDDDEDDDGEADAAAAPAAAAVPAPAAAPEKDKAKAEKGSKAS